MTRPEGKLYLKLRCMIHDAVQSFATWFAFRGSLGKVPCRAVPCQCFGDYCGLANAIVQWGCGWLLHRAVLGKSREFSVARIRYHHSPGTDALDHVE